MSANNGLKQHQGATSPVVAEIIAERRIAEFCRAVGAEPSRTAPPTFLTVFRGGEFGLFDRMGLELANVLHGEQRYTYESEIEAGDEVEFQTTLSSVLEKKGSSGSMSFLSFETEVRVRAPRPRKIGTSKTTVIVRQKGGS